MNKAAASWPLSLRVLHWLSAALVLFALALGVCMVQWVRDPAWRFELTQTHKSVGIAVLALTVVRLCRRSLVRAPKADAAARALRAAAAAAHAALYALLLLMPLSGWVMTTTTPVRVPTSVFGLFPLPYPLAPDLGMYRLAHAVHVTLAIALAALIVLHVGGALFHVVIWRAPNSPRLRRGPQARLARRREAASAEARAVGSDAG